MRVLPSLKLQAFLFFIPRLGKQQFFMSVYADRESKKGATRTMAITLSILDRFAKFFHCCKEH